MRVVEIMLFIWVILCTWANIANMTGMFQRVDGLSMYPTLHDGDLVLMLPIIRKLNRYDVVDFHPPGLDGQTYIKRVIGMPGETIQIKYGSVYVDGEKLEDDLHISIKDRGIARNQIQLGDDEYFVLGDNRNHANDSRYFGVVKRSRIKKRMYTRIYPLSDKRRG